MNPDISSSPTPMSETPKKSNTPMIIAVVVVIVLCICCVVGGGIYYLYQNGDKILGTGLLLMQSL